jgi:preprotein translocase subunit SecE
MAVAEARKMEKDDGSGSGPAAWFSNALGWGPRKFQELRSFATDVRGELKKVTWPSRNEVYSTTIVVLATTVFFGFYLYAVDLLLTRIQVLILR